MPLPPSLTGMIIALTLIIGVLLSYPSYPTQTKGIVLVTGVSPGSIGWDAAEYLCQHGFHVLASSRTNKGYLACEPGTYQQIFGDVRDENFLTYLVEDVERWTIVSTLPFVGVVPAHGVHSGLSPVERVDSEMVRQEMDINYISITRLIQLLLPIIRADRSRIVFIGSLQGVKTYMGNTFYSSSKFALHAFADGLSQEMVHQGVSVSTIIASGIRTPMLGGIMAKGLYPDDDTYTPSRFTWMTSQMQQQVEALFPWPRDSTTPAIVHGLTNMYPSERYFVGGVYNSCPIEGRLVGWIPAWVFNPFYFHTLSLIQQMSTR